MFSHNGPRLLAGTLPRKVRYPAIGAAIVEGGHAIFHVDMFHQHPIAVLYCIAFVAVWVGRPWEAALTLIYLAFSASVFLPPFDALTFELAIFSLTTVSELILLTFLRQSFQRVTLLTEALSQAREAREAAAQSDTPA